jgi:predicted SnoaL-like aldol condensation-catalyzing enzyme
MTNKEAATDFLRLVVAHREAEAFRRFVGPGFVHHNPFSAPDAASLQAGMEESGASMPGLSLEILHALEDGDLVAVHSRLKPAPEGPTMAVVHLFRFSDGKMAEFWDVGQPVPGTMANSLGMF